MGRVIFSGLNECYTLFVTWGHFDPKHFAIKIGNVCNNIAWLSCPKVSSKLPAEARGQVMGANHGGEGVGAGVCPPNLAQSKKNVQNHTKIEKFVIRIPQSRHLFRISIQGMLTEPRDDTKSWFQPITSRGSGEHFELYTTCEYPEERHDSKSPPRSCKRFSSKLEGVYTPRGSRCTMPQNWPVTCGHGSGTPLQKLGDWKGVQMRIRWISADQTEKWGYLCTSLICS